MLALCALGVAVGTDVQSHRREDATAAALSAARAHLSALQRGTAILAYAGGLARLDTAKLHASIDSTVDSLGQTNSAVDSAAAASAAQQSDIATLHACLGGVQSAYSALGTGDTKTATQEIAGVSGPCTSLAGLSDDGLVYPFDFPDPDVVALGGTFYAYATNSVAGNIQIIQSSDLAQWTVDGNALPQLPAWAAPHATWAPAVVPWDGRYLMYYAVDTAGASGTHCISVASATTPVGPFTDSSSGPLVCQPSLGGSIDPSPFVGPDGSLYLVWKSGGEGSSLIWSEKLGTTGTAIAPGTTPAALLQPVRAWQAGTIEAPDLVAVGGRDLLFYSGNNWDTSGYGVGVASCAGPLGPCTDLSPRPLLSSAAGVSGPGSVSVFSDATGGWWIAFDGWISGAVGYPNSRSLFVHRLDLSGAVPVVGAAP